MPPTRSKGNTARAITIIPIPPNHWRSDRQSNKPGGAVSKLTITVAPVVVIPDIASKNASVKLSSNWENAKGSAANMVKTTQLRVGSINAWRTESLAPPVLLVSDKETPTNSVTPPAAANTCQSGLSENISTAAGTIIMMAKVVNRNPSMRNMGRKSITAFLT